MAGNKAHPTIKYSIDSAITVSVQLLTDKVYIGNVELGSIQRTTWAYDIEVGGRTVFKGNNLMTFGTAYTAAALKALQWFMVSDNIKEYDPHIKGGRGNWAINVVPRNYAFWSDVDYLDQIPGVLVLDGDGTYVPLLNPDVPEVTLSEELPTAQMDYVDPDDETPPTYANAY